ncbi:zinc finger, C3HC4 type [Ostertagia ostertagi]
MDKRCLVRDFACILCQRICNIPVATTVCMHRFCESCMSPRIAAGNLRCPRCNMQLDQNQPVCHDSNFQDIITKIDFDLNTVHDLITRKPHSACEFSSITSDEEYMDMCGVSEERRKIIRKKTAPQSRINPLAAEHAFYWDRKFQGSNALVQRYLKKMGLPHHDPPLPLPKIPEHDGGEVEERRPFRIYGNLINHVPPPLRDKRIRDGASGGYDAEYKLFECNKDHVWPTIEKKEPNRFGITAEYRKSLVKTRRVLRPKPLKTATEIAASECTEAESEDDKPVTSEGKAKHDPPEKVEAEVDVFLEKEATGESSSNGSVDSEDVNDMICNEEELYFKLLEQYLNAIIYFLIDKRRGIVEVVLRPNRNPKSSSRIISTRELSSFYLFVDEAATVAHLQQFLLMRIHSQYPKTERRVSILISKILWECKAARLAMLQCARSVS